MHNEHSISACTAHTAQAIRTYGSTIFDYIVWCQLIFVWLAVGGELWNFSHSSVQIDASVWNARLKPITITMECALFRRITCFYLNVTVSDLIILQ